MSLTRRTFLTLFGTAAASLGLSSIALGYEQMTDLRVTSYRPVLSRWPADLPLRIVALADIHACSPWMTAKRIADIVSRANALEPDVIVLLGDYVSAIRSATRIADADWAAELARLRAPLGVHAVLGNHDWDDDYEAQRRGHGPVAAGEALKAAGVSVYDNDVVALEKSGRRFWLAGLGDQRALPPLSRGELPRGVDDLPGTLAKIGDDAPVILLAHEPDIFPDVPARVALTMSGHTHGGQIRLFGQTPVVPSKYGSRYAYGHIHEMDRDLIVSGGLGCSGIPVRFGVPPEIVMVELGAST